MLYLRARHYRPANGTFVSRDPFEGTMSRPMSRNGYSWVEGRVADGRDASGMSIALSRLLSGGHCASNNRLLTDTTSRCLEQCRSEYNLIQCFNDCETGAFYAQTQSYLDASVQIVLAGDNSNDGSCTQIKLSAGGLGTLTNDGLWTHDHFTGIDNDFYKPATNPTQTANYLRVWPCIVITGRNGQVRIKGSDLSVDGSTKPGTLRLDHSQILATGETVDLRALGTPIGVNPRWNHNAAGYIYAAHIKGFNGSIDVKWLNHSNVGLFSFFGAIYDPLPRDGRDTHFTNFHFIVQSLGSDYSQEGDSGGGVFFEGALIGVTLAANVLDAPIGRNSVRFVVLQ